MGKGDQRSRRGKIWRGTFGKRRPKKSNKAPVKAVAPPIESGNKPVKKKSAPLIKSEVVESANTGALDSPAV